ncbi:hypothetical protein N7486_002699 [Penicillium sp. IBT 16267x]|nr:hypothetical protein N7486_002699 [Penicillium sp. IBT 16267x]
MSNDQSLSERIEFPTIPLEAQSKIAHLQEQFVRAEVEQLRASVPLLAPLFKQRDEIINLPEVKSDFWVRVFSTAPAEIDEYILPSDATVLGQTLKNMNVERFEVNEKGQGEPRSLRFTFTFSTGEENPYFENSELVKEFYWRKHITRTASGKRRTWEGLVSEPVRINWKKDMDITKGLLDATCDLFDAEKKKGGERAKLPEFEALVNKLSELEAAAMKAHMGEDDDEGEDDDDDSSPAGISFFNWFGYRGHDVTAEQSKEANKEDEERWAKISKGEKVEDEEEEEDDDEDDEDLVDELEDCEAFPDGEELAISLAEDLWTDAMKYYVQSFEIGDDLDDLDMEELEADMMEEDHDHDHDHDHDEEHDHSRPRKKVRT